MIDMKYAKKELAMFKASFQSLGKSFGYVLLIEVLLLSILIGGAYLWRETILNITDDIIGLRTELEGFGGQNLFTANELRDDTAVHIFGKIVSRTVFISLLLFIIWTLIKQKIYCLVNNRPFGLKTYWRWALTTIVWTSLIFIVFMVIQNLAFVTLAETFVTKMTTRIIVFFIFTLTFLILYWFTINLFTHLIRSGKIWQSVRAWWKTAIKGFGRFLAPLLLSVLVFIATNVIMFLFILTGSPDIFMILSTIILLVYLTWARFYYTDVIDGMAVPVAGEGQHVRRHAEKKHLSRKHIQKKR